MTATQSFKIYELLNAQFQQPDKARELTDAIEAVIDMKVSEDNWKYKILPSQIVEKMLEQFDVVSASIQAKLTNLKTDLTKAIYIVAIAQYIGIVSSVLAIILFVIKH